MKNKPVRNPFWRSLTLRMFAMIILPMTLLSMVIAIGSVIAHQQKMRLHLSEDAWKIATDPTLEFTLLAPLVLIPPLLFTVGALWFAARQIVQPLQKLETKAAALAWGDFEAIQESVGGILEVQHLQSELIEMARKVKAAQVGLHDYIGAITSAQEEERARLAREFSQNQNLIVGFQKTGQERRLTREVELSLYRIAQEALNNVSKHSKAARADLNIAFENDEIIVEVIDNGNGFVAPNSPTELAPRGHFGLLGIHERADLIGARLELESTLGKGTSLTVRL